MTNLQKTENQRGEIEFRRKLVKQQVEGEVSFEDEFSGEEMSNILRERMDETQRTMSYISGKGVRISPYIEIGAERCQRSLVMESDLKLTGAAVDLSFDMLKSCAYYSEKFGKERIPLRICVDIYRMPFRSGSVPFVFCYQTLHHFPDPTPIIRETHRIIQPGGSMFFAEEPYKKGFHLPLYKGSSSFSVKHRSRSAFRKALDHLFAKEICNEVEHGVVENDDISLKRWRQSLNMFRKRDVHIKSLPVESDLYRPESLLRYLFNWFWGGEIKGLLTKEGSLPEDNSPITETLICADCLVDGKEVDLIEGDSVYSCPECSGKYPIVDNVLFLLTTQKRRELYPEIEV